MATRRAVRSGDVDIAVYEEGNPDGETVLLLHGWPDSHLLWEEVAPYLTDRFKVVRVDNRGHGASTNPRGPLAISVGHLADDYRAVIEAVSPDRPVHIIAHDWGSVATWELVTRPANRGLVASFTSVSGPSLGHVAEWIRGRLRRPTPRNVLLPLAALVSFAYSIVLALPVVPNVLLRLLTNERRWRAGVAKSEGVPPERVHLSETFRDDIVNGLRIYRSTLLSRATNPVTATGVSTDVPVQVIIGTRDPAIRHQCFEDEARWADPVHLRVVAGGHWLPFSHPELIATAAVELIDSTAGAEPARGLRRARLGVERKDFEDQLVVVTGAGSGIGRATALAFARAGADVVVSDLDPRAAQETAAVIGVEGGRAYHHRLDVSDREAVTAHAELVLARYGVPDILVNNAGVGQAGLFVDTTAEEFDRVLAVNLHGVLNMCRAFTGAMVDRGLGGRIVNISSMAAYAPQQRLTAYSTSKSAVFMFSDCLRAELAESGIGVSTVCPGIVHTDIVANTRFSGVSADTESQMQDRYDRMYRRRGYGPDKVAAKIVRAVLHGVDVVPVTPEAVVQYHVSRLAPSAVRAVAARSSLIR